MNYRPMHKRDRIVDDLALASPVPQIGEGILHSFFGVFMFFEVFARRQVEHLTVVAKYLDEVPLVRFILSVFA